MNKEKLEALLGRSLTEREETNIDLYLEIAGENLEDLLCNALDCENGEREFSGRDGYSTLFTGIFTEVSNVSVNGVSLEETDYYPVQWDKRTANWYNSIVFKNKCYGQDDDIVVNASWGFGDDCMPGDLAMLIAQLFAQVSKKYTPQGQVTSKQIEDFRIAFRSDVTEDQVFLDANSRTIRKYSTCGIGQVQSGEVRYRARRV